MVKTKKVDELIVTERKIDFMKSDEDETKKPIKDAPIGEFSLAQKTHKDFNRFKVRSNFFYRLGILGDWLIKRQVKRGCLLAEVIFPNKNSQKYLISLKQTWVEVKEGDDIRFFDINPLIANPSRYVRYEGGIPVITLDWDYPHPIPIKPLKTDTIDLDTFSTIIMKQRTKASAQPIKEFLEKVMKDFVIIKYCSMASAGFGLFTLAKLIGWI
jgi:hypothetical protein